MFCSGLLHIRVCIECVLDLAPFGCELGINSETAVAAAL
jgi:hypothetical protein